MLVANNPLPQSAFNNLGNKPFENIVGKREKAGNQHFLFSHNIFYQSEKIEAINPLPDDKF